MKTVKGLDQVIPQKSSLPKNAPQAPLLDLPRLFKTDLTNIPAQIPYFFPQGELAALAQRELETKHVLKIGLCWQGNPDHSQDAIRSLAPAFLKPLNKLQNVKFFSLQKGKGAEQARKLQKDIPLFDLDPFLKDFFHASISQKEFAFPTPGL